MGKVMPNIVSEPVLEDPAQYMFNLYAESVSFICPLNTDIVLGNVVKAREMPFEEDKVVPLETAVFLADNAGFLSAIVAMNYKNIRIKMLTALDNEIGVDDMTAEERKAFRDKTGEPFADSKAFMTMGLTNFASSILSDLCFSCSASFETLSNNEAVKDDVMSYLQSSDESEMSHAILILSNFVYLLRVFSHNANFVREIMSLIDEFKSFYGIS